MTIRYPKYVASEKTFNNESLWQWRPPGKGAFNDGRFQPSKRAEDHGLRPPTSPPPWRIHPDGASKAKRGNTSRRRRKGRYPPQGLTKGGSADSETPQAHLIREEPREKGIDPPPENRSPGYIPRQEWHQKLLTENGAREIFGTAEASKGRCPVCWNKHVYPRKFQWGSIPWPSSRLRECGAFRD